MSTASSEVEQMDDHEASAAALDDIVVSICLHFPCLPKPLKLAVFRCFYYDVFSFFERGTGIQRLGRGGISCHGNPRCTCFSLKTGQLVIMTTTMKQVKLGLRALEPVKSVNQEALDIVQRVCHKGHIMDHLSLHR